MTTTITDRRPRRHQRSCGVVDGEGTRSRSQMMAMRWTPRGSMTSSTFYDEDLGEVLNLSGHGTWAHTNLCEIIQEGARCSP